MRRAFAIFFLLLLPLQSVWAAAGTYCQHQSGSQAQHFGHHHHQHQASHDLGDADNGYASGFDGDCGDCHAACAVAILGDVVVIPPQLAAVVIADYRTLQSSPPLEIPERPNWVARA